MFTAQRTYFPPAIAYRGTSDFLYFCFRHSPRKLRDGLSGGVFSHNIRTDQPVLFPGEARHVGFLLGRVPLRVTCFPAVLL